MLWDVGEYSIGESKRTAESDSEDERRMKKRKISPCKEDPSVLTLQQQGVVLRVLVLADTRRTS